MLKWGLGVKKRMPVAVAIRFVYQYYATDFKPAPLSDFNKQAWKLLKVNV